MSKGKPPKWACRTRADIKALKHGAYWDQEKADAIIDWCYAFFKPQYIVGEFRLIKWQKRFLQSLYGWRWSDARRRWRYAILHVSKKQGKSLLVAIICAYEIYCSEERSPYVACCSASESNAGQVFREIVHTIKHSPYEEYSKITTRPMTIRVEDINAYFAVFAAKGSTKHGEPCSCIVVDECHAHGSPQLISALESNHAARKQSGILIQISTCGDNLTHWYYEKYVRAKKILSGESLDMITYAEVYEADAAKDIESDEQILAANPSIPESFTLEQFRMEMEAAKETFGTWINFKRQRLNIWTQESSESWLDVSDYAKYTITPSEDDMKKWDVVCGNDLSETTDPSSSSLVFHMGDNKYYITSRCWITSEGKQKRDKGNLAKFDDFIGRGEMEETEGNLIDRSLIKEQIIHWSGMYKMLQANFDPTSAYVLMNDIESEGIKTERMSQSFKYFNTPMIEFSRAYKEGRIFNDGNQWLKYCLSNVRVEVNKYDEIRPFKRKSVDSIDGAISTLLAFASFVTSEPQELIGIL